MSDKPENPALGPFGSMLDTMEFVKKAWSQFNVPTSFTPTLDVGELDQRIADLRAVEHWLSMNLNMLKASIQGMEIQRGTLVAVKAFGDAVGNAGSAMSDAAKHARAAHAERPGASPRQTAPGATDDTGQGPGGRASASVSGAPPSLLASMFGGLPLQLPTGTQMVDPGAWWQLLQGQFNQVAQAAMSGAGDAGGASQTSKRSTGSPRARSGASRASTGGEAPRPTARSGGRGKATGARTRSTSR